MELFISKGTLQSWPKILFRASLFRTLFDTLIVMLKNWRLNKDIASLFHGKNLTILRYFAIIFNHFLYSQNLHFCPDKHIFKEKFTLLLTNVWKPFFLHYTYEIKQTWTQLRGKRTETAVYRTETTDFNPVLFKNYSPQCGWLVVDIYRAVKRWSKYPPFLLTLR